MPLASGRRLGHFEIVAPLGAGGMGEVYRARDTRLGRLVAIKVLPEHLAATSAARARFDREARTVSQLNHPHICTLHDVGHDDGIDYLVMELLEGETLHERLARGPLPLAELVALGRQIASALDRAHRAGVVHRDLKPGNVMLTAGGAKLLDFGLAGSAALVATDPAVSQSPTIAQPLTARGTLLGTFMYMAPEQLEGRDTDARTDIWALGCVLYEMATGARAFSGDSEASLIAAIMTGQPRPLTELIPLAPPGLDRLIRRCLEKRAEARPASAQDVAFMLELVAEGPPTAAMAADAPRPRSGRRLALPVAAAGALVLAAAAFLAGRFTAPTPPPGSIRISTLSQGTRDYEPAVSRDGRLLTFSAVRETGPGLWLMDLVTRSEIRLTDEDDHWPRFAPDGGSILFSRIRRGRQSLWRVPVIGGAPRLVIEDAFDADCAPDGSRIAYIASAPDSDGVRSRLMVARADGTGARELWSIASAVVTGPRWSRDGQHIAVCIGGAQNTPNSIGVVDASSGAARAYPAPNRGGISNAAWDGTGTGVIVAEGEGVTAIPRGAPGQLYRLDTRSGRFRALGWLEKFPAIIDLLPDGKLVMSSLVVRQNLCEVGLEASDLRGARWLTRGLAIDRQPVYSPDGAAVMFSSNRGGSLDLWEVAVASGEMHRVTDDPADDWDPEYHPDGQSIAWCSARSGVFEIWTARRDGSAPRQVSRDSADAENPSFAPDGSWLIYSSAHPRRSGLWRVPAAGGEEELLIRTSTLIPDLSPDGRHVSIITEVGTIEPRLSVFALAEREALPHPVPLQVLAGNLQVGRSRFTADGAAVAYVGERANGKAVVLRRSLEAWRTGAGRVDTLFAGAAEEIESFGFSPDGRRAVLSVVDWLSALTIAEGVPGIVPPKPGR